MLETAGRVWICEPATGGGGSGWLEMLDGLLTGRLETDPVTSPGEA